MKRFVVFLLSILVALPLSSQGFGFGFDDEGTGNTVGEGFSVNSTITAL